MGTDPNVRGKLQADLARGITEALRLYAKENGFSEEFIMQQARDLLVVKPPT